MTQVRLTGDYRVVINYDLLPADAGANLIILSDLELSIVNRVLAQTVWRDNLPLHILSGQLGETLTDAEAVVWRAVVMALSDKLSGGLQMKQNANTLASGPVSGAADYPSFRTLNVADVPHHSCRVYQAAQNVANSIDVTLAFGSERWDPDGMHDPVTNNSRLTAQVAGTYLVIGVGAWDSNSTNYRQLSIVASTGDTHYVRQPANASGLDGQCVILPLALAAGDYVEMHARQTSGGTRTVTAEFSMVRLY